jgi:sec-independent protein translocase protein TatA
MLQMGMPGGPELLVIALLALVLFGVPLALVVVFGSVWLRSDDEDYEQRIAELEADVARLRSEMGDDSGGESPSNDASDARED